MPWAAEVGSPTLWGCGEAGVEQKDAEAVEEDRPRKPWHEMTEEERAEEIRKTKLPHPKWKFAGFRGPGHGVPFYAPENDEYFFVHHVRDGADCFKNVHHDQASYRMHYMVVRRMYFVNDWPVFSPEPFAGESKAVVTLAEYLREQSAAVNWEWLQLKYADNTIAVAKVADLSENVVPENTYVFKCFDFENSREVLALSGMTDSGECVWGKLV